MNAEKLKQLQAQVRIGGKGSARRKKKVVHREHASDEKKIQATLKKMGMTDLAGIEEVNMFKDDGEVIHFNNPKVQALPSSNTFSITGHAEVKHLNEIQITDMLPTILSQLRADNFASAFKKMSMQAGNTDGEQKAVMEVDEDDEVPDLVENFDEASKAEVA